MSPTPRVGFVLSHEQFPATRLVELGVAAENAGLDALWTSDVPYAANPTSSE